MNYDWAEELRFEEGRRLAIGVVAQRMFYKRPRNDVSLYWGVGPGFSASLRDAETHNGEYGSDWEEWIWTVSLDAQLGVEWRLMDQFSLGARYQWGFGYWHESEDRRSWYGDDESESSATIDGYDFDANGWVDLVLTVYY